MTSSPIPGAIRASRYLPMRDGTRIAIDVWLPARRTGPVPAVLRQTRYLRSIGWRPWARRVGLADLLDISATTRRRLLEAGYAWIDVDARGSGASEGFRPGPWSPDEVADGAEVVDWIVRQPWSDGTVGATGVSYGGTSAEMLLVNRHPAVKAIVPRFSLFDVYADVACPGGIHLSWFTESWSRFNALLDRNAYDEAVALMTSVNAEALVDGKPAARPLVHALQPPLRRAIRRLVRAGAGGVVPVPAAEHVLSEALAQHEDNLDVHGSVAAITHRDDRGISPAEPDRSIDALSPHAHAAELKASGAAVLSVSGWMDGAYMGSAIKRHHTLASDRSRLLLGPWDHGGRHDVSPFTSRTDAEFDHDGEIVRFFDRHLRGRTDARDPEPVRFYLMGAERWEEAAQWPPRDVRRCALHLSKGRRLQPEPGAAGHDALPLDAEVGTGKRSRWRSLLGLAVTPGYGDRREVAARVTAYESPRLRAPLELVGHPVAALTIATRAPDATLFVYLEHVAPDGRVTYVTEGQIRALHRATAGRRQSGAPERTFHAADARPFAPDTPERLEIELWPTAHRVPAGHRLRLAIAGRDVDHFAQVEGAATRADLLLGDGRSVLELPVRGELALG